MEIGVSPNPCTIKNTPLEALFVIYVISLVLLPGKYLTKSLQKGVHTVLCAAKNVWTHAGTFLYRLTVGCCGTPSMTTHTSLHQANTDKHTEPFAVQLTNTSAHTRTCIHAHLITAVGCGSEAVTNCPASGGYPLSAFLFCSLMLF